MPSTYTGSGIELIGDGEQSGSWGNTTNNNLEIINRLVSEAGTITLAGTTHTLTIADGTLSDGQYAVLVFGGAPSGTNTVTLSPNDAKRVFIVKNDSGESVVLTQGSGGNVTVGDGKTAIVYSDGAGSGAAVVNVSEDFVSATLSAIGALTPTDGNFIVGNGSTWVAETGDTVLNSIGVTATTTELNVLDGITASTAELNVLDGITASTAELNYTDGVTSSIQTQLNNKQPLDAELTAIAALATTDGNIIVGNGSTWVAESGATARTSLGLGSIATQNSNSVTITGGSISGITDIAVADGGTGASTAANARTNLGVAIGTDVQAWDANLDQIAALTPTDGNFIVGNGSAWVSETGDTVLNSIGVTATTTELNVLDGITATTAELNVLDGITATTAELNYTDGVTSNIQTQLDNKQPLDADLTAIGALAKTDGNFIVGNGSTWVAESGNTAISSLGVTATAAELNFVDGVTSNIQTQLNAKAATSTSISAGEGLTGGGDLSASRTISHADTSSQSSVDNSGNTFVQDITLDTYGHVTGLTSAAVSFPDPTAEQVTTAYAGASAWAVGTYTTAWYALGGTLTDGNGSSIAVGTTIAGSSLRVPTSSTLSDNSNVSSYPDSFAVRSGGSNFTTTGTVTLSGTWRVMTSGKYKDRADSDYAFYPHLWLRIS
jgi:cell division septation protein DedD